MVTVSLAHFIKNLQMALVGSSDTVNPPRVLWTAETGGRHIPDELHYGRGSRGRLGFVRMMRSGPREVWGKIREQLVALV